MIFTRNILLRLVTTSLITILLWSQSSFIILPLTHAIHYNQVRNSEYFKCRDTIYVSAAEEKKLNWIRDDEIKYHGKMFDVKKVVRRNGDVLLVGHYDTDDDMLFASILKLFDDDTNHGTKDSDHSPVFTYDAVLALGQVYTPICCPQMIKHDVTFMMSFYTLLITNNTAPPPRVLSV